MLKEIQNWRRIVEGQKVKLTLDRLSYKLTELAPAVSKETLEYHYGNLAKGYVDRYNAGEGDPEFNQAGAFLHNILFAQYRAPQSRNLPKDSLNQFIVKHFDSFDNFKHQFSEAAMKIQGSGWVYLSKSGQIKTITNHQIKTDIILLVDWWEHAWALDYQHDKQSYLKNQWTIMDWSVINDRLQVTV